MNNEKNRFGGKGVTLTEVLIAVNVMIVALLGFDSALRQAHAQVRGNQEINLARVEVLSAVEQFRAASVREPEQTVANYTKGISESLGDRPMGRNVRLMARLSPNHRQLHLRLTWDGALGRREFQHVSPVRVQDLGSLGSR
jgi:hypothetical protein